VGAVVYRTASRDPEAYFERRQGDLAELILRAESRSASHRTEDVELISSDGLRVEAKVRYPATPSSLPTIIILGGHRTGKDAVELVDELDGFVVAAISYPHDEEAWSKGLALLRQIPAARRALLDTPPALSLLVDYLVERSEVDPDAIELVGVSLGAPIVTVAGARDERFRRVWAIHGGGAPAALLDHNLRDEIESRLARSAAARLGALLIAPLTPERHVSRIAPRPLILVNAEADERIPRLCVESLYDSARDPKELIWLSGAHIDRDERDQITSLVQLVVDRVGTPASAS